MKLSRTTTRILACLFSAYCLAMLCVLSLGTCGCASTGYKSSPVGTSRETAVQTPDHTGLTWFEPPAKGAK